MKKYILSAFICFNLLNESYAQQVSGFGNATDNTINASEKKIDPAKLSEREVSQEINAGKSDILLDVKYRKVEIKTWNQPKVKVTTTVLLSGKSTITDEQWFDKLNLTVKQTGSRVQITSGIISSSYFNSYSTSGLTYYGNASTTNNSAVFDGDGNRIGAVEMSKRSITIFIPEGNKLEIENQSGDLQLTSNLQSVTIKSTNGSIEAGDINKLVVRSKYTPLTLGNVKDAEIEIANGRVKAGNIDKLDIDSKYTNVDIASVNNIMLRSANDEYEIEEAGELRGRKTYGSLRINNLKTSVDIEGANADIKVKNISPSAETITINNKYADVRLPVNGLKNYEVKFNGNYNTVFAPFEKKAVADTAEKTNEGTKVRVLSGSTLSTARTYSYSRAGAFGDAGDTHAFTAEVGDIKGKHTRFVINCASCTVDFK